MKVKGNLETRSTKYRGFTTAEREAYIPTEYTVVHDIDLDALFEYDGGWQAVGQSREYIAICEFRGTEPVAATSETNMVVIPPQLNGFDIASIYYRVSTASPDSSTIIEVKRKTLAGSVATVDTGTIASTNVSDENTGLGFNLATGDLLYLDLSSSSFTTPPQGLTVTLNLIRL